MITCHRKYLSSRCLQRGYTLEEVRGCIVHQDGDMWTIDETHPAYPREAKTSVRRALSASGPGTELKKLLGRIGITASPTCSCNARARTMDAHGCDWCEANVDLVVGWLREEAGKRRLPFLDAVGKLLVRRAIANARKEEARAKAAKEGSD